MLAEISSNISKQTCLLNHIIYFLWINSSSKKKSSIKSIPSSSSLTLSTYNSVKNSSVSPEPSGSNLLKISRIDVHTISLNRSKENSMPAKYVGTSLMMEENWEDTSPELTRARQARKH